MKIKEVLDKTTIFFKEKKIESARLDAELLIANALGLQRIDLYLKFDQPVAEGEIAKCRESVRRRATGEPVAYILGKKDFYGHSFAVNKNVLIPRPETELLVEEVLTWVDQNNFKELPLKILDIGAGSGCIGVSLLKALPRAEAHFLDISTDALFVVEQNAKNLNVFERTKLLCQDAFQTNFAPNSFDIIVSNPPYVAEDDTRIQASVVAFEPHLALFSADNGLHAIERWSGFSVQALRNPGIIAFEFGADQSTSVQSIFGKICALDSVKIVRDLAGLDRHFIGIRNG